MTANLNVSPLSEEEQSESVDVLEVLPKHLDIEDVVMVDKTWKRIEEISKYRTGERIWLTFHFDDDTTSAVPYDNDLKVTVLRTVLE